MLSKIKSPSLIERRSPLVHHNHNHNHVHTSLSEGDQVKNMSDVELEDDDNDEGQLVIDQHHHNHHSSSNNNHHRHSSPSENNNNNNNNNNDDNNNNNVEQTNNLMNNSNHNHNNHNDRNQVQNGKKTQNELLDIIEVSKKRRLSKDSADSLTSFIRWSFSHFDTNSKSPQSRQQQQQLSVGSKFKRDSGANGVASSTLDEDDMLAHNTTSGQRQQQQAADSNQHDDEQQQQLENNNSNASPKLIMTANDSNELDVATDKAIKYTTERVLRNRAAKFSSAINATSFGHNQNHHQTPTTRTFDRQHIKSGQHNAAANVAPIKRSRLALATSYSPDDEPAARKFSHHLGTVVERLHQQRQGLANQIQGQGQQLRQRCLASDAPVDRTRLDQSDLLLEQADQLDQYGQEQQLAATSNGLSLQLQQFFQQQQQQQQIQKSARAAYDDLLPGVGGSTGALAEESAQRQHQLALAAAIHRALVNGNGGAPTSLADSKVAASLGLSLGHNHGQTAISSTTTPTSANQQHTDNLSQFASNLVDSLSRQQQRHQATGPIGAPRAAYNTRGLAHAAANLASNRLQQHQQQMASIGSRAATVMHQHQQQQQQQHQQQQQRHAQAAAALSALANGAHPAAALHHFAAAAAAAAAAGAGAGAGLSLPTSGATPAALGPAAAALVQQQQRHQQHQPQQLANIPAAALGSLSNQTDFKCDTCPSSFDDRHRLMQHQSIHLELKKDWFTETPVEEVMKIFNRRRGEFLCNLCNLRFEATLDYDQHNHQVHGPRPYCCQFCGNGTRTFKCWRQYLNHLYDHRYIFSCTIGDCDFTVNRRDSLRFHIFRFHLNCQLPQNHQHQSLGAAINGNGNASNAHKMQTSPFNLSQNINLADLAGDHHRQFMSSSAATAADQQRQQHNWSNLDYDDEEEAEADRRHDVELNDVDDDDIEERERDERTLGDDDDRDDADADERHRDIADGRLACNLGDRNNDDEDTENEMNVAD